MQAGRKVKHLTILWQSSISPAPRPSAVPGGPRTRHPPCGPRRPSHRPPSRRQADPGSDYLPNKRKSVSITTPHTNTARSHRSNLTRALHHITSRTQGNLSITLHHSYKEQEWPTTSEIQHFLQLWAPTMKKVIQDRKQLPFILTQCSLKPNKAKTLNSHNNCD